MATKLDDLYSIYKETKDTLHQDNLQIEDAVRQSFPKRQQGEKSNIPRSGIPQIPGGNLPKELQTFNRVMRRLAPGFQRLGRSGTQMRRFMRDVGTVATGKAASNSFIKQASGEAVGGTIANRISMKRAVKQGVEEGMRGSIGGFGKEWKKKFGDLGGVGLEAQKAGLNPKQKMDALTSKIISPPSSFDEAREKRKRRDKWKWTGLTRRVARRMRTAKRTFTGKFMDAGDIVQAEVAGKGWSQSIRPAPTPGSGGQGWSQGMPGPQGEGAPPAFGDIGRKHFTRDNLRRMGKIRRARLGATRGWSAGKSAFSAARASGAGLGGAIKAAGAAGAGAAGAGGAGGAVAAGGAGGAAAGGVAAAGAAIASNPVGWAVGIAAAVVAIAAMPFVLAKFNDALLNSQRHLENFSGGMAAVFANQEVRETMRNIRSSHARATIAGFQQEQSDEFWDNMQPMFDLIYNIFGAITGGIMWALNQLIAGIKWFAGVVVDIGNELVRLLTFGLVDAKEFFADQKETNNRYTNLGGMLTMFGQGRANDLRDPAFEFPAAKKKK